MPWEVGAQRSPWTQGKGGISAGSCFTRVQSREPGAQLGLQQQCIELPWFLYLQSFL